MAMQNNIITKCTEVTNDNNKNTYTLGDFKIWNFLVVV
jgi:hypothetical protein